MKIVLFIFVALFFLLVLFLVPINLGAKVVLDAESKSFYYSLKGGFLKISSGKMYLLEDFSVSVINDSIFFMNIKQPNIDKYELMTQLLKKISVKKVVVLTDAGIAKDAFSTAMVVGFLNAVFESLPFCRRFRGIEYEVHSEPIYGDTNLTVAGEIVLSINFLQLVLSLLISKHKTKKVKGDKKYV